MAEVDGAVQPATLTTVLSFPLPKSLSSILHIHLSSFSSCMMVHVTTTTIGESAGSIAPLGSFVYAMPDRLKPRNAISTPISTSGSSIDYATRLSKILAIKMHKPVYVGCSVNFAGSTAEEELEGLTRVVEEIVKATER